MLTNHLFPPQPIQIHVTLFSKFFSHFPHGTCCLSAPDQCCTFDELYHQFCIPAPRNATLQHMLNMDQSHSNPRNFTFNVALLQETSVHTSINNMLPFCKAWLHIKQITCDWHCSFAITWNPCKVFFPPPTYMLKFSGLHRLTACNNETQHPKPHLRLLITQNKVCIGLNYSYAKQWNSASCGFANIKLRAF